ncbi:hypothetical protein AM500_11090 [Bacillus sp. FJAT-18017]|uniref:hypothetical protein n=1 Tax=Bacillus sp. FJAT-18017 TaxID=1705566 RepID=UPI0006AF91D8|nr:hypothetical protein [Bacillus sp. FJAT-18017]ALC90267.1 hypothetical protein AM500_11090 [Bacillus sp. FJAT-18017]
MKLLHWSYTKRYNLKGIFDTHPNSTVLFRQIKDYYFIYTVKWDLLDPPVKRDDLDMMEILMNTEMGTFEHYRKRKAYRYAHEIYQPDE